MEGMKWQLSSTTEPTPEEAAAISAVLAVVTSASAVPDAEIALSQWENSGKLVQQGLSPARTGVEPRWHTIERLRQRAAGGFYGIIGL